MRSFINRYQIAAKYTDLDEESSLHVAKECLISFRFEGRFTYHGNPWGVSPLEVVGAYTVTASDQLWRIYSILIPMLPVLIISFNNAFYDFDE